MTPPIVAPCAAVASATAHDEEQGLVFNIQRYSLHDGAGIRTVVFLKGCPLRCLWCSNPESQSPRAELAVDKDKCLGRTDCGLCADSCQERALNFTDHGRIMVQRERCTACLTCVSRCPTPALKHFGRTMTAREVVAAVEADEVFYARSQGGLTLSGGEPLMQGAFAQAILRTAKRHHLNTALETCGYGAWRTLASLAEYCDAIFFDVKSLDDERHRHATHRSNRRIVENLQRLRERFPTLPIHVRTPLIPGFNDSIPDIAAITDFVMSLPDVSYEILPYHRLGRDKYRLLGRDYALGHLQMPDDRGQPLIALARRHCGARYGEPVHKIM